MTETRSCFPRWGRWTHTPAASPAPEERFSPQSPRSSQSACRRPQGPSGNRSPSATVSEFNSFHSRTQSFKASSRTRRIQLRSIFSLSNRGVYARSASTLPAQLDQEHLKFWFPVRSWDDLGQTRAGQQRVNRRAEALWF